MFKVKEYDLPDFTIFKSGISSEKFSTWVPTKKILILGRSNKPEASLKNITDDIEIYKRPSGGETVILTPKTLVLSKNVNNVTLENSWEVFQSINQEIIKKLEYLNIRNLHRKGISDITINEKKILGSSIYRTRNRLFYHAVLNVAESVSTISKYILHPKREPDYRKGRSHDSFVTSIWQEGYHIPMQEILNIFK